MPNTREKLIELLNEAEEWADNRCDELGCENCPADKMKGNCVQQLMVDRLIANGVTLANQVASSSKYLASSEWIPVTERLPEQDELVLCVGKKGGMFLGEIHSFLVGGKRNEVFCYVPNSRGGRYATHWMPLPEPPKGE